MSAAIWRGGRSDPGLSDRGNFAFVPRRGKARIMGIRARKRPGKPGAEGTRRGAGISPRQQERATERAVTAFDRINRAMG